MLQARIVSRGPLDQKHCIQSVLRFLPLKTTFALAPVSKAWASVAECPSFHPERFLLEFRRETQLRAEVEPHSKIANISDIPASAFPKIGKVVSIISNWGGLDEVFNNIITLSPTFFPNVTSLTIYGDCDRNADFYKAFSHKVEGIDTRTYALPNIFDKGSFPKLKWIVACDLPPNGASFPQLSLVFGYLRKPLPQGFEMVDNFLLWWGGACNSDNIALSEARMEGARTLIFHVEPDCDCWDVKYEWSELCKKMKEMLESSRAFLQGKKLIFLQENLSVANMIPDSLPHFIYDKKLFRYEINRHVMKDLDKCLKCFPNLKKVD